MLKNNQRGFYTKLTKGHTVAIPERFVGLWDLKVGDQFTTSTDGKNKVFLEKVDEKGIKKLEP